MLKNQKIPCFAHGVTLYEIRAGNLTKQYEKVSTTVEININIKDRWHVATC